MLTDKIVHVHHLLHGSIEPCEEHALDNEDTNVAYSSIVGLPPKGQFKTRNRPVVLLLIRVGFHLGRIIQTARDDHFGAQSIKLFTINCDLRFNLESPDEASNQSLVRK